MGQSDPNMSRRGPKASSHGFTLTSTGGIELRTIFHEKQPLSPHFEERPAIRYVEVTRRPMAEPTVASPSTGLLKVP